MPRGAAEEERRALGPRAERSGAGSARGGSSRASSSHPGYGIRAVAFGRRPPPFPEGSAGLAQTLATDGAAALAESMESAFLAHCREALARPNVRAVHWPASTRGGAMDFHASLYRLFARRIEHDIGAALRMDAVLREGSTVRSIVRAVLPHVRARQPPGPPPSSGPLASGSSRSVWVLCGVPAAVAVAELASMRPDAISGVALVLCGDRVVVGAPGAGDDAGGSERSPRFPTTGWLSDDVAMDGAHARLIEWPRSVRIIARSSRPRRRVGRRGTF